MLIKNHKYHEFINTINFISIFFMLFNVKIAISSTKKGLILKNQSFLAIKKIFFKVNQVENQW